MPRISSRSSFYWLLWLCWSGPIDNLPLLARPSFRALRTSCSDRGPQVTLRPTMDRYIGVARHASDRNADGQTVRAGGTPALGEFRPPFLKVPRRSVDARC